MMGKYIDQAREKAISFLKRRNYETSKANINKYILKYFDNIWRKEMDEDGLALGFMVTEEAIPIIAKCLEKKDPAPLRQWEQEQLDNMKDGETW